MTSTPVVGKEIDGAVDVVEFVDQPIGIVVHRCTLICGRRCAKAGRGKQDNVADAACRELVGKGRPDGTGFGNGVHKDLGGLGHTQVILLDWTADRIDGVGVAHAKHSQGSRKDRSLA